MKKGLSTFNLFKSENLFSDNLKFIKHFQKLKNNLKVGLTNFKVNPNIILVSLSFECIDSET